MGDQTVKDFAIDLGLPVNLLIEQFNQAGIKTTINGVVTDDNKHLLLDYLRKEHGTLAQKNKIDSTQKIDYSLNDIKNAGDLIKLNQLLTQAMAERKIQSIIKEDNLDSIIESVLVYAIDSEKELLAAAILGRLAAVARGRESIIWDRADEIFSVEPPTLDCLVDGDAKQYAAQLLTHVKDDWVKEYSYRESLAIETAEIARTELLSANLIREGNIADWVSGVTRHVSVINNTNNFDARLTRVRRTFSAMSEVAKLWRGDIGTNFGEQLSSCIDTYLARKITDAEQDVLFDALDQILSILVRIIELRFSNALYANTYSVLEQGKKILGPSLWGRYIGQSSVINNIRSALLESALVLARQNRSDKQIMAVLAASYTSKPQTALAIKRHFENVRDLDPDIGDWWRSAGEVSETQRHVEHKVGNSEDSQIGALLIEVESNRETMDKVGRAVVQYLEISDPVLASTVKKAVDGYQGIAQTARRLARMRKLTKTDLKGERLEYNPLEHEMLGGHKAGVRRVKVVRDGIMKEFSGKIKTLVKPWVEPEE